MGSSEESTKPTVVAVHRLKRAQQAKEKKAQDKKVDEVPDLFRVQESERPLGYFKDKKPLTDPAPDLTGVKLDVNEELGVGTEGRVYVGTLGDGSKTAIKVERTNGDVKREYKVYEHLKEKGVDHPNIGKVHGMAAVMYSELKVEAMVMDVIPGKDGVDGLRDLQAMLKNGDITYQEFLGAMRLMVKKLLQVSKVLDEAGVTHSDIKPDNFIIDERTGEPVVIDLGMSVVWDKPELGPRGGTDEYMAPEQEVGKVSRLATDVFNIGASFVFGMEMTSPLPGSKKKGRRVGGDGVDVDPEEHTEVDEHGKVVKKVGVQGMRSSYTDFVEELMHSDPKHRLTVETALTHPFLTDTDFSDEDAAEVWKKVVKKKGVERVDERPPPITQKEIDDFAKRFHTTSIGGYVSFSDRITMVRDAHELLKRAKSTSGIKTKELEKQIDKAITMASVPQEKALVAPPVDKSLIDEKTHAQLDDLAHDFMTSINELIAEAGPDSVPVLKLKRTVLARWPTEIYPTVGNTDGTITDTTVKDTRKAIDQCLVILDATIRQLETDHPEGVCEAFHSKLMRHIAAVEPDVLAFQRFLDKGTWSHAELFDARRLHQQAVAIQSSLPLRPTVKGYPLPARAVAKRTQLDGLVSQLGKTVAILAHTLELLRTEATDLATDDEAIQQAQEIYRSFEALNPRVIGGDVNPVPLDETEPEDPTEVAQRLKDAAIEAEIAFNKLKGGLEGYLKRARPFLGKVGRKPLYDEDIERKREIVRKRVSDIGHLENLARDWIEPLKKETSIDKKTLAELGKQMIGRHTTMLKELTELENQFKLQRDLDQGLVDPDL